MDNNFRSIYEEEPKRRSNSFKNHAFIKSFNGHNNEVSTIKKIMHPTYGECLISQGLANEQIKMWINS